jgi:hypothetical protein
MFMIRHRIYQNINCVITYMYMMRISVSYYFLRTRLCTIYLDKTIKIVCF